MIVDIVGSIFMVKNGIGKIHAHQSRPVVLQVITDLEAEVIHKVNTHHIPIEAHHIPHYIIQLFLFLFLLLWLWLYIFLLLFMFILWLWLFIYPLMLLGLTLLIDVMMDTLWRGVSGLGLYLVRLLPFKLIIIFIIFIIHIIRCFILHLH